MLEVLVASALLAIALGAVLMLVREYTAHAHTLRSQTLAHWVAVDRVHELRLQASWPAPGVRRGEQQLGDQNWHWRQQVQATAEPDMRVVIVQVRAQPSGPVLAHSRGWLAHTE